MHSPIKAFTNSCNGIAAAWREDNSFRYTCYQAVAGLVVATAILVLTPATAMLWLLMTGSLFPMVIAETINCSVEAITDKASPENHPLAKKAKDMGSAAVMIARLLAILCWGVALGQISAL